MRTVWSSASLNVVTNNSHCELIAYGLLQKILKDMIDITSYPEYFYKYIRFSFVVNMMLAH